MLTEPLSIEVFEELTDILVGAIELHVKLTPWEFSFITDMRTRVDKWNRKVSVSDKQWAVLRRIQGKLG